MAQISAASDLAGRIRMQERRVAGKTLRGSQPRVQDAIHYGSNRVLTPDGVMVLTIPNFARPWNVIHRAARRWRVPAPSGRGRGLPSFLFRSWRANTIVEYPRKAAQK